MSTALRNIAIFKDRIQYKDTYWTYLDPEFEKTLADYLPAFEKFRLEQTTIPAHEAWKSLPFGKFAVTSEWKWRRESLSILQKQIKGKRFETVLEIGPWNGWLTKYLAQQSEIVIAADYFTKPYDGIGNIQTLDSNITAVQCNVENLEADFNSQSFDLIVLNHCLAYVGDPVSFISGLKKLLKTGGEIISLGNSYYIHPETKRLENERFAKNFETATKQNIYIQPVKGYLDRKDIISLKRHGFKTRLYPQKIFRNIYAQLNPTKPVYVLISYTQ
jgi:SAM-dependent methyltransferase